MPCVPVARPLSLPAAKLVARGFDFDLFVASVAIRSYLEEQGLIFSEFKAPYHILNDLGRW